ncbi:MAG: ABC transporter permease subunit [Gammaproteobacteria bacterium]|nr:ABC transporter permease subunit [Gammaproteobacteria bacterium]MYF28927.1 ABC transporter permease subunit [Gammaproteobacteria bacterium]MYK46998.1 ABC transporter permease subunit [Gammaproteobacteria bacterium]
MRYYLLRRLAFAVVTLWAVVTVTFFLVRLAPGGPFDGERRLPAEVEANLRAAYDLDQPLLLQYGRYVVNLLSGDLGPSFRQKDFSVNELIGMGLPISVGVGLAALSLALAMGVAGGTFAALSRDGPRDRLLVLGATLGLALPPIVVAPVLVLLFAVSLGWFPAGGYATWKHFVLPAITLALPYAAAFMRLTRGSVLEVLSRPHVVTARAKGLGRFRLVTRHVLPSALLPVVSFLGPAAAGLLAGSMVIEEVFSLPGLGRYFVQGALNRDYTLVTGAVVVYAALVLGFNLLVDLCYARLDPRIRHA